MTSTDHTAFADLRSFLHSSPDEDEYSTWAEVRRLLREVRTPEVREQAEHYVGDLLGEDPWCGWTLPTLTDQDVLVGPRDAWEVVLLVLPEERQLDVWQRSGRSYIREATASHPISNIDPAVLLARLTPELCQELERNRTERAAGVEFPGDDGITLDAALERLSYDDYLICEDALVERLENTREDCEAVAAVLQEGGREAREAAALALLVPAAGRVVLDDDGDTLAEWLEQTLEELAAEEEEDGDDW